MHSMIRFTLGLAAIAFVGCGNADRLPVAGSIVVGGQPVDRGLITFAPVDPQAKPSGAAINDGRFATEEGHGLLPGDYQVTINALRLTGRQIQDRMSPSPVDEIVPIKIKQGSLPSRITITTENANNLSFDFPADQ